MANTMRSRGGDGQTLAAEPALPDGAAAPYDLAGLQESMGGDPVLAKEMLLLVYRDAVPMLGALQQAVQKRDLQAIGYAAHALKGALAIIFAKPSAELAGAIERHARDRLIDRACAQMPAFEHEYARVVAALRVLSERS